MAVHISSSESLPRLHTAPYTSATYHPEEEHRLYPRPLPQSFSSTAPSVTDFSDPLLCVTPEKPSRKSAFINSNKSLDSSKGSQKVRFDSTVEVKHLSPHETSTETSNLSSFDTFQTSTSSDDPALEYTERSNGSNLINSSLYSNTSSDSKGSSSYSTIESEDVDFVDVLASDLESREAELIYGKRTHKKCVVRTSIWGQDGQGDNVLARPEFNSTILLRKELQGLKDEELNIDEAVKQKLVLSDKVRSKVSEKASAKLNTKKSAQFEELISIEVREEDVIARAEKEKTSKVKPVLKAKQSEATVPAPDILEFFTDDLQRETACCALEGIPPVDSEPKTVDLSHAFDVYRHIRAWEGW